MNDSKHSKITIQPPNEPRKRSHHKKPLRRDIDAPLQDIGSRQFEPANTKLHAQRDSLLLKHYGELRDVAFDAYPQLSFDDAENIIARLSGRIHQFAHVPLEDNFLQWATAYVSIQARRQKAFDTIISDQHNLASARKGAWSVLQKCADLGIEQYEGEGEDIPEISGTVLDIQVDVLEWIFANLTALSLPGKRNAKLTTRLYRRGALSAMTWRNQRIREKAEYADPQYVDDIAENYQPGKLGEGRQIHYPA